MYLYIYIYICILVQSARRMAHRIHILREKKIKCVGETFALHRAPPRSYALTSPES